MSKSPKRSAEIFKKFKKLLKTPVCSLNIFQVAICDSGGLVSALSCFLFRHYKSLLKRVDKMKTRQGCLSPFILNLNLLVHHLFVKSLKFDEIFLTNCKDESCS